MKMSKSNPQPRIIAVVTGSRAEFGLLKPVIAAMRRRRELDLRLIVAGAHLVSGTWREAAEFGRIDARVRMQKLGDTSRAGDVQALSRGIAGFGRVFARMQPDAVLVLGDRIEVFAAASAAAVGGFRVAHIHGGDRAEGVADESMRHAVSKLAHLHFAASALSRKRLIRMGEPTEHVFNAGSPAMDALADVVPAEDAQRLIIMQHPIGADPEDERRWMAATLRAARRLKHAVMMPNTDAGRDGIVTAIRAAKVDAIDHLPRERWLSLLAGCSVLVGNSSAGLIEAAGLKVPCVNIGPRQGGRERPANVIDCKYGERNVRRAIDQALALDLRRMRHPYGDGRAGERIAELLATLPLDSMPVRKHNAY